VVLFFFIAGFILSFTTLSTMSVVALVLTTTTSKFRPRRAPATMQMANWFNGNHLVSQHSIGEIACFRRQSTSTVISAVTDSINNANRENNSNCHGNGKDEKKVTFFPPHSPQTVKSAFHTAENTLRSLDVPESEDSARHILAHVACLGTRQSEFVRALSRSLSEEEINQFENCLQQRARRVPVQYIIGNWDFYGLTFLCRPPILIPRPETEELVHHIVQWHNKNWKHITDKQRRLRILDVGAGSGAIGIALAHSLPQQVQVTAIDINPEAVALANENARILLIDEQLDQYRCVHSSFENFVTNNTEKFDLIVSNPPYIPSADIADLQSEVVDHEDHRALDGGSDGLDIVWQIVQGASLLMDVKNNPASELWMEVYHLHPDEIRDKLQLFSKEWEFVELLHDVFHQPRFVRLRLIR
jgi:release factor glutamine methyltransferase